MGIRLVCLTNASLLAAGIPVAMDDRTNSVPCHSDSGLTIGFSSANGKIGNDEPQERRQLEEKKNKQNPRIFFYPALICLLGKSQPSLVLPCPDSATKVSCPQIAANSRGLRLSGVRAAIESSQPSTGKTLDALWLPTPSKQVQRLIQIQDGYRIANRCKAPRIWRGFCSSEELVHKSRLTAACSVVETVKPFKKGEDFQGQATIIHEPYFPLAVNFGESRAPHLTPHTCEMKASKQEPSEISPDTRQT
ncbi:hypothetical protein ACRRTK_007391 [Alexandromys fortis]